MARKKKEPPVISDIEETTQTIFRVGEEIFYTRKEAERAVLIQKIVGLMETGDDSLPDTDLYRDDVIDWVISHMDDLLALRPQV